MKKRVFTKKSTKPKSRSKKTAVRRRTDRIFPVVGLGGSAGSFEALEKFFNHLPSDTGMAFVLVMHLDPNHQGQVAEMIGRFTPLKVSEAADGMDIEPDHVYVIPPNKDLGIHNLKLLLLPPSRPKGFRMPIDYFLQSLSEDLGSKAVAIIFSGMGSDGETGVRMIKEKLGLAIAQDPESALYNSMPRSAIATNMVDYVLVPEEMPLRLIQYMRHPVLTAEASEQSLADNKNANSLHKILMLVRSQMGHDFSSYKKSTITRRIDRRLAYHQLPDYARYVTFLRENPGEMGILFNELLIGVTKFFRDASAFDALKDKLFPVLHSKPEDHPIRVWVAGCSTGEEAYSIAIIISEYLETLKRRKLPKVQIFATDLDAEAIEVGRQGKYLDNIVADVDPVRLQRFFIKEKEGYVVKKELREMIIFAHHNLIKDAPFTRLDLLSCRNLMIYLNADLQKRLIPIFHYAINTKGLLFLGPAETIGGFTDMFLSAEPKWKIFERRQGASALGHVIDFPFNVTKQETSVQKADMKISKKNALQESYFKVLLEHFTPASVLINDKGDILYVNGKMSGYLEVTSGEAAMNIHKLVRPELKHGLSNAILQARNTKLPATIKDILIREGKQLRLVTLRVFFLDDNSPHGLIVVVFEDTGLVPAKRGVKKGKPDPAVEELEKQLMYTKEQLNTTIEQMETSVEELKSTNEELQSTNEELQTTNEESLTTKEEMQSLNEELMTINMQYQSKGEELTHLNNDMKNLLDNTEIGTIFLDNKLEIMRFTPQVTKLFNLIATDVGRPISHVVSNFRHPSLEADIREVVEKLNTKELEVRTVNNEWYGVRIMPYRTQNNFINGAVLTFQRITPLKILQEKLSLVRKAAFVLFDRLTVPALMLDQNNTVIVSNTALTSLFHFNKEELPDKPLSALSAMNRMFPNIDKPLTQAKKSEPGTKFSEKVKIQGLRVSHVTVSCLLREAEESVFLVTLESGVET